MKSIIIGTAGHIDHGKTALVKALTGIDADRLEEEKRRGITIDLGFAHLELPGADGEILRFGFVDVPGHEKFVRNMLAGIGGIDLVLLVIAADEGIKPQTREHFDICRLLGIQRGITVLTKSDLVDSETLEVIRLEIAEFLRGSFLESAPIVPVSSIRGTGLDDLKRALVELAAILPPRDSSALTRLPIDRVFTMKGFGTVVTGTLISGTISKENELELFPHRKRVRVRGVQVHGATAEKAVAGERTALNLAGVEKEELERGMILASPNAFAASSNIEVQLTLLPSARPLKSGARVHFHAFSMETIAAVTIYKMKQLVPADRAFAQLRLSVPGLLLPGDRFIIRQFSPVVTIGGGVVIENAPPARVKDVQARCEFLSHFIAGSGAAHLRARVIERGTHGLRVRDAVARTGWMADEIVLVGAAVKDLHNLNGVLIQSSALEAIRKEFLNALNSFQKEHPLTAGAPKELLRERLTGVEPQVFEAIFQEKLDAGEIDLAGELVRLRGQGVRMTAEEERAHRVIEQAFASAGLKAPALKDVLAGLTIDKARAQKIVTLLLREKVLIKISEELVFHRGPLDDLKSKLASQKARSPKIDVSTFKDLAGVSRKYAIPLLEYLDRERVTKRVGDSRVIL